MSVFFLCSVYIEEKFGGDILCWNFNDFGYVCMMIFRVFCGEWIELLYDSMWVMSFVFFLFFLIVLVIGNFLVSCMRNLLFVYFE